MANFAQSCYIVGSIVEQPMVGESRRSAGVSVATCESERSTQIWRGHCVSQANAARIQANSWCLNKKPIGWASGGGIGPDFVRQDALELNHSLVQVRLWKPFPAAQESDRGIDREIECGAECGTGRKNGRRRQLEREPGT